MSISSTSLNEQDYLCFKNNFQVFKANVSTLEEAEVILFGEDHTNLTHRLKNCWLLNKLATERDTILVEGIDRTKFISRNTFQNIYNFPCFINAKIKGWDSEKSVNFFYASLNRSILFVEELTLIADSLSKNMLTIEKKKEVIEKICAFHPYSSIIKEIDEMQQNKIILDDNIKNLADDLQSLEIIREISQECDNEKLNFLFLKALKIGSNVIGYVLHLHLCGNNFHKRQLGFSKEICSPQSEGCKIFGKAGKAHLKWYNDSLEEHALKNFSNKLKRKKYVILFPTKNDQNIEPITQFFKTTLLEKIASPVTELLYLSQTELIVSMCAIATIFYTLNTVSSIFPTASPFTIAAIPFAIFGLYCMLPGTNSNTMRKFKEKNTELKKSVARQLDSYPYYLHFHLSCEVENRKKARQ